MLNAYQYLQFLIISDIKSLTFSKRTLVYIYSGIFNLLTFNPIPILKIFNTENFKFRLGMFRKLTYVRYSIYLDYLQNIIWVIEIRLTLIEISSFAIFLEGENFNLYK